jgi:hypothetical protein
LWGRLGLSGSSATSIDGWRSIATRCPGGLARANCHRDEAVRGLLLPLAVGCWSGRHSSHSSTQLFSNRQWILIRSTTKISVSPGLITRTGTVVAVAQVGRDHQACADHQPSCPARRCPSPLITWPTPRRNSSGVTTVVRRIELLTSRVGHADVVDRNGRHRHLASAPVAFDHVGDLPGRWGEGCRGSRSLASLGCVNS